MLICMRVSPLRFVAPGPPVNPSAPRRSSVPATVPRMPSPGISSKDFTATAVAGPCKCLSHKLNTRGAGMGEGPGLIKNDRIGMRNIFYNIRIFQVEMFTAEDTHRVSRVKGVERARAQGQAIISTEVKAFRARPASVPIQKAAAKKATARTSGVK